MSLSIDTVIDEIFELFSKFRNAASLGKREIRLDWGAFPVSLESFFIPTTSGNEGYMVSKVTPLKNVKMGQPELSIAYSSMSGLDNIKGPKDVARLFEKHLIPPGGEKVGIVKVYGSLVHYGYKNNPAEIIEHQVQKPKYNIEAPLGVIVISDLNLDPRFNTLQILQEAKYDPQAPMKCCGIALEDLKSMPTYRL
jgi:hypothetical protein